MREGLPDRRILAGDENHVTLRSAEYAVTVENELVTSKTLVSSVTYSYDTEGALTKKRIKNADGTEQVIFCETNDGNTVIKFSAGGRTVTSHSKTDSFGRKVFDELQLGTGCVSRRYDYHTGEITPEHQTNAKVKSSATTQLVSRITFADGRTLSYEYDAEERITSVVETYTVDDTPVTNTTLYTYDALGQLLTETVNGVVVNSMTYDSYGNITEKNGKAYTYGNTAWKDLLTSYNGQTITYDAQGNPTSYLGHTLTWEKGRRLRSFDGNTYTYNANGIRTSKTINGVKHEYTLDGTKILREAWGNNVIVPMYDNEDSVCGITYNGTPYYFLKNLQGDVIAIVDANAETVARYTYDAWGVCTIVQDSVGIATINPYRYRSYYYDAEIGLYYLLSRYYDACVGRFINGDSSNQICLGFYLFSYDMFNYCNNSPIVYIDKHGFMAFSVIAENIVQSFLNLIAKKRGYENAIFKALIITSEKFNMESQYVAASFGSFVSTRVEVYDSAQTFQHIWNSKASKYDIVIVNSHATPIELEHSVCPNSNYKKLKAQALILLGCNAGHKYYRKNNIAKQFSKYVCGCVMASDGTVQSDFMEPKKNQLFTSILSNDWIKFCPLFKRKEEHSGWMIYSYRSGHYFVYTTNKYKLSVNEMIQYLIDYSFVSFGYYVPYYYSSPDIPVVI